MTKLYQAKIKDNFIKEISGGNNYIWLFDKTYEYEEKFGVDLYDFSKEQLIDFLNGRKWTANTLRAYFSHINVYVQWAIENNLKRITTKGVPEITAEDLKSVAKPAHGAVHVDVIYGLAGIPGLEHSLPVELLNSQDKLLIYLSFLGVGGKEAIELRSLRLEHIDRENKLIKLSEINPYRSDIPIDNFGINLIDKAVKEYEYYKYIVGNAKSETVELEDSGYIFKRTAGGIRKGDSFDEKISYQTILYRLKAFSEYTGEKITFTRIERSGVAYIGKKLIEKGVPLKVNSEIVKKVIFDRYSVGENTQIRYRLISRIKDDIKEIYGES